MLSLDDFSPGWLALIFFGFCCYLFFLWPLLFPHKDLTRASLEARHEAIAQAYGAYCADPVLRSDCPGLDDVTRPETVAFLHAYTQAAEARTTRDGLAAYQLAVDQLERTWAGAAAGVPALDA